MVSQKGLQTLNILSNFTWKMYERQYLRIKNDKTNIVYEILLWVN